MGFFDKFFSPKQEDQSEVSTRPASRNSSACPNCGTVLAKPPKRKATCPDCGKEIYVRTKQQIFNTDLLTKEQALASDFFEELFEMGTTIKDFEAVKASLAKKWDFEPKPYDIVWSLSNRLITAPLADDVYDKKREMLYRAKMIGFSQAKYQAMRGKDPTPYMRTVNNYDVQLAEQDGFTKYMAIETDGCCSACTKYQGKKYSIDELKKSPVLPIKECKNTFSVDIAQPWCLCLYSPVI